MAAGCSVDVRHMASPRVWRRSSGHNRRDMNASFADCSPSLLMVVGLLLAAAALTRLLARRAERRYPRPAGVGRRRRRPATLHAGRRRPARRSHPRAARLDLRLRGGADASDGARALVVAFDRPRQRLQRRAADRRSHADRPGLPAATRPSPGSVASSAPCSSATRWAPPSPSPTPSSSRATWPPSCTVGGHVLPYRLPAARLVRVLRLPAGRAPGRRDPARAGDLPARLRAAAAGLLAAAPARRPCPRGTGRRAPPRPVSPRGRGPGTSLGRPSRAGPLYRALEAPFVVLVGAHDRIAPPAESQAFHRRLPPRDWSSWATAATRCTSRTRPRSPPRSRPPGRWPNEASTAPASRRADDARPRSARPAAYRPARRRPR